MKNRFKKLMVSLGLAIGVIAPSLSVQKSVAQQKSENAIWASPMDRWGMAWASNLTDSVINPSPPYYVFLCSEGGVIQTKYLQSSIV